MNVTVVGSFRDNNEENKSRLDGTKNDFTLACESIGEAMSTWQHRLIVPHPEDPDTAEWHVLNGFTKNKSTHFSRCPQHKGDPTLKAHFDAVEKSDAVILVGGLNGTYAAGLSAMRRRKLILPIPVFGGSAREISEIQDVDITLSDEIRNLSFKDSSWRKSLVDSVEKFLNAFPRILIIHGRGDNGQALLDRIVDESKKDPSLKGIAKPLIMNLMGSGSVTIPDIFEKFASQVSAAIAIVTADDIGAFASGDGLDIPASKIELKSRARENIWVEVGWFWGRLGRERVCIWRKDKIELPSDLQGVARVTSNNLDDAWLDIKNFLTKLRYPEPEEI
jgi:hypothetical protein